MYPPYLVALTEYNRALAQKNALLKQLRRAGRTSDAALSVWNESLAESGEKIMASRAEFIQKLSEYARSIYSEMGREEFSMRYAPDCADGGLLERLESFQRREIENGSSLAGIQRDDVEFLLDSKPARIYGSQGQQRSSVLAVKLAQCEYINSERDEYPVLLLDDVMSELDAHRRSYLSDRIRDKQVIITCTDIDKKTASDARIFHVSGGKVNVHSSGK
jgi:DNA replication and repair protein RecF